MWDFITRKGSNVNASLVSEHTWLNDIQEEVELIFGKSLLRVVDENYVLHKKSGIVTLLHKHKTAGLLLPSNEHENTKLP